MSKRSKAAGLVAVVGLGVVAAKAVGSRQVSGVRSGPAAPNKAGTKPTGQPVDVKPQGDQPIDLI